MKKIAVGDLGEFWYGDYKEPFEQLEGAVEGYPKGTVLKSDDGRLLCAFCGKVFHQLGNHAAHKHDLKARAYKEAVGLLQKTALVSEQERLRAARVTMARYRRGDILPVHGGRSHGNGASFRRTPEHLNKTGRCRAQVVEVARQLARAGRLSYPVLRKHGVGQHTVEIYFGTLDQLKAHVGSPTWPRYTNRHLLDALRALAFEIGRTPTDSDLRRYGLASGETYRNHFGSFSEACRQAGLAPNLPIPLSDDLAARVLTVYATTGSIVRIKRLLHLSDERVAAVLARYGIGVRHGNPKDRGLAAWRQEQRALAATIASRLAGVPDEPAA